MDGELERDIRKISAESSICKLRHHFAIIGCEEATYLLDGRSCFLTVTAQSRADIVFRGVT